MTCFCTLPNVFALVFLSIVTMAANTRAEIRMPSIFGDHMVLQRDALIPVWGWAAANERVTVNLGGRDGSATAGADGKWRVDLPPCAKDAAPQLLKITGSNSSSLSFQDVLVGDVWIASGQSNMEFGIQSDSRGAEAIKQANDPALRLFFVPVSTALEPQTNIADNPRDPMSGKWQVCTPEIMAAHWAWNGFSAVGYYFAREIRNTTGAPVGMIAVYKGGTPAQAWISIDGLGQAPAFTRYLASHRTLVEAFPKASEAYPKKLADYETAIKLWNEEHAREVQDQLKQWNAAVVQAHAAGQTPPPKPSPAVPMPTPPLPPGGNSGHPANLYNGMVAPLVPYGIKGIIWYQGEGNAERIQDATEYATLFPRLIADWREKWSQPKLPFLYVQLANFRAPASNPSEGIWPWLREAQLKTLAVPYTGMASAIDIGDATNIHPKDKLDVGLRLALAARHVVYGENLVDSGPIFESSKVQGDKIRLTFRDRGKGLAMGVPPWTPGNHPTSAPKTLTGFGVAGVDRNFVWADAVIDGETVLVSSAQISQPAAVRYDWADCPAGNLYNKDGLPAPPFRTDDWAPPATIVPVPAAGKPVMTSASPSSPK